MNLLRRITAMFTNRPGSAPTHGVGTPLNEQSVRPRRGINRLRGRG